MRHGSLQCHAAAAAAVTAATAPAAPVVEASHVDSPAYHTPVEICLVDTLQMAVRATSLLSLSLSSQSYYYPWLQSFGCRSLLSQTKLARGGQLHCCVYMWSLSGSFLQVPARLSAALQGSKLTASACVSAVGLRRGAGAAQHGRAASRAPLRSPRERPATHRGAPYLCSKASWHSCTCCCQCLLGPLCSAAGLGACIAAKKLDSHA